MVVIKFKEYIKAIKKLMKTKSLVILRCPYCDSIDLHYFKDTLEEKDINSEYVMKRVQYGIYCRDCNAVGFISEGWNDKLRKGE